MRIAVLSLTILCLALSAPAFAGTVYNDGPINGTVNAFIIDGPSGSPGQTISDGFVASGNASAGAVSIYFGEWVRLGSTPTTISWALGTTVFGNDVGQGTGVASSSLFLSSNPFGFSVYETKITGTTILPMNLGSTYYLT